MKKSFLLLATALLGAGQLFADTAKYDPAALYKTLPAGNTKVTLPYTWEAAPYQATVTIAKEGTTTQAVASAQITLAAGTTITVSVPGTIDGLTFNATTATLGNISTETGNYANGTWTPGEEPTSTVVINVGKNFPLKGLTVNYTPGDVVAPLSYVQYNGQRRENCIATDIIPVTETQIGLGFNVEGGDGDWRAIFSGRNVHAGTGISLYKNGNNSNLGYFTGGTTGDGDGFAPLTCGQDYDIIADVTKLQISTDGGENYETIETGNTETIETSRVLTFFANPEWDSAMKGKIYYAWIKNGEETIRNYTPAITHEGKIGFWESVEGKFVEPREKSQAGYSAGYKEGVFYLKSCTESISVPSGTASKIAIEQQGEATSVKYYTANDKVATVAEDGTVTGVAVGTTTIYVVIDEPNGRWNKQVAVEVTGAAKNQYTTIDWIHFDGSDRENCFTTDYNPVTATTIKIGFNVEGGDGDWRAIFCARNTHAGTGISLYKNGNNSNLGFFTGGTTGAGDGFAPLECGKKYDVIANVASMQWSVEGGEWQTKETGNSETNATSRNLSLFANPEWDAALKGTIYYCTITEGESTIYELKPAVRHDGVMGFYDATSGKFFTPLKSAKGYTWGLNEENTTTALVSLPVTTVTTFKGFKTDVTPLFTNCNAADYTVSYTSADETIASVEDGQIVGAAVGTTDVTVTISAKESDEVWVYTATVTVEPATVAVENVETSNIADGIILGSIRRSGDSYKPAYTVTFDSGKGYSGAQGSSNPEFNYVWGVPAEDETGKAWYEADYAMTNTETAVWSYNSNVLPNGWPSNMGEVYVRRYFTTEGELSENIYMAAPHDDAPCEYYINGTLVWARTGYEPGVNGWYEDEVVKLNAEQTALIKTDGTVNVFAYHVHQNWGGRYADGGLYCAGTGVANDFENNETLKRLRSAVAQAETAEGVNPEVLEYAKNATVCKQDAGRALDLVRFELKKALAPRHNYEMASAEPADGLECWLYNVGTGMFMAGNNDWGTHVSVENNISAWPMILRANTSGENRYAIQTNLPNGRRGANDGLGHNGYVDCGYGADFTTAEGWAWEFKAVGNGNYYIINSQNSGNNIYLGVTEDARYQVDTDKAGADNLYNQWKVITRDMFEAMIETATAENPADLTYYIHQNTFSQNDFDGDEKGNANADLNDSKWERNAGSIWNWKGNDANGDYVFEAWNTASDVDMKLSQVIEGLPAGKYIVKCTGYYRDGNWDSAVNGNSRQLAYLYAGSQENQTPLPSILDGAGKGAGYGRLGNDQIIPDGCNAAAKFFQYGAYQVQVEATVGTDGKLEIGVCRPGEGVNGQDWVVVDNFSLYCTELLPVLQSTNPGNNTFVEKAPEKLMFMFNREITADMVEVANIAVQGQGEMEVAQENISVIDGNTLVIAAEELAYLPTGSSVYCAVKLKENPVAYELSFTVQEALAVRAADVEEGWISFNQKVAFADDAETATAVVLNDKGEEAGEATLTYDEEDESFCSLLIELPDLASGDYTLVIAAGTVKSTITEMENNTVELAFTVTGTGIATAKATAKDGKYIEKGKVVIVKAGKSYTTEGVRK